MIWKGLFFLARVLEEEVGGTGEPFTSTTQPNASPLNAHIITIVVVILQTEVGAATATGGALGAMTGATRSWTRRRSRDARDPRPVVVVVVVKGPEVVI